MLSYAARQYSMKGALGTVPNPMTALSISKYLHLLVLSELREPGGELAHTLRPIADKTQLSGN
jgi:hypothetical protein